ncbi:MAG TPA: hypothetical protein GXX18_06080 [Bacillales bacterium]|nr:hypothetical protein [Bacillales bacterium]
MNEQRLQDTINELKCLRDSHIKSFQVLKTYKEGTFVREAQQQMKGFISGLDISIQLVEQLNRDHWDNSQGELEVNEDDKCRTNFMAAEGVKGRAGV